MKKKKKNEIRRREKAHETRLLLDVLHKKNRCFSMFDNRVRSSRPRVAWYNELPEQTVGDKSKPLGNWLSRFLLTSCTRCKIYAAHKNLYHGVLFWPPVRPRTSPWTSLETGLIWIIRRPPIEKKRLPPFQLF